MNTQEQLRQVFRELEQGTFLKPKKKSTATGEEPQDLKILFEKPAERR